MAHEIDRAIGCASQNAHFHAAFLCGQLEQRERIQGRSLTGPKAPDKKADPIIVHADVRRTLMQIRSINEAGRAFMLWTALKSDIAHRSPDETERLAKELLADEKEAAEHAMLVDLARNDVGRVSKPGTVRPTETFVIERYSHVMHIVSNVVGERVCVVAAVGPALLNVPAFPNVPAPVIGVASSEVRAASSASRNSARKSDTPREAAARKKAAEKKAAGTK